MCQNQNIGTLGLWKIKRVKIHCQSSTKKTEVAQTASVFILYGGGSELMPLRAIGGNSL